MEEGFSAEHSSAFVIKNSRGMTQQLITASFKKHLPLSKKRHVQELALTVHWLQKGLPLNSLKGDAFAEYHRAMGWAPPPHPQRIRNVIIPLLNQFVVRETQQYMMKNVQFFSITTDGWTDSMLRKFVAVTYHFIDDNLRVRSFCGDVIPLSKRHTWDVVTAAVASRIQNTVHPDAVLVATVTDNAANFIKVF
jgi:hypothetical protein